MKKQVTSSEGGFRSRITRRSRHRWQPRAESCVVLVLDGRGRIAWCRLPGDQWMGRRRGDWVGVTLADCLAEATDRELLESFLGSCREDGTSKQPPVLKTALRHRAGHPSPVEVVCPLAGPHLEGLVLVVSEVGPPALCARAEDVEVTERDPVVPWPNGEQQFRAIFDHAIELMGMIGLDGTLLAANRASLELIGRREEELVGRLFWTLPWWSHSVELQAKLQASIERAASGQTIRFEATHLDARGELHDIDFSICPVTDEEGRVVYLVPEGRDITSRKRAEEQVQRLNRLHAVSSSINEVIVRIHDPVQLYTEACHIAVDKGWLQLAWVGLVDEGGGRLQLVASAGQGRERLAGCEFSVRDDPFGRGPVGRAFRSGQPAVADDVANNPAFQRSAEAASGDSGSCAAFPIKSGTRTVGVLAFFSEGPRFFGEAEVQLLNAVAGDISFALAVQASEAQFRRLVETSPLAMSVTRHENEIIYLNPKFTELFGYTYADLPTVDSWWPRAYPDPDYREQIRQEWFARIYEGAQGGTGIRPMEAIVTCRDGSQRHIEFQTSVIGVRTLVVFFDLTERKAAEQALRESEERFSKAFRASPDVMSICDLATARYIEVNDVHERLFGYSREEVIGRTPVEIGISEDSADRERFLSQLKQHGVVREFELKARNRQGRQLIVLISAEITQMAGRQCVLRVTRDITERKAAEEALRESQRALSTLLCNLDGLAYRCYNDEHWTTEFVSEGCRELTGFAPEQLSQHRPFSYGQIIHPEDRDYVRRTVNEALAMRRRFEIEYRIVTADGTIKRVWERGVGVYSSDGPLMFLEGFVTDVTEARRAEEARREMEAQLRQTQKLEAIGTLAGGIAHDFNNILGAILAYTELALMESRSSPVLQDYLSQVVKASQRATDLVRQILSFSRQRVQERRPLRPATVVREALKLLRPALPATIDIEVDVDDNTPEILADATQVHQVVMNLSTNAAHAMQDRPGRLTIQLGSIEVDATFAGLHLELSPGPHVRLVVADTGHGMDEATLKRIFEPFFTTKDPGKGTGLGLSVVHGIVREHEGIIRAESRPGHGTRFEVLFPQLRHGGSAVNVEQREAPRGQLQRVLFIDDEQPLCDVASRLLQRLGYRPTVCQSPAEALRKFREQPHDFDVVITDLTMPGMTGVDLARELLLIRPTIPIILASGFASGWTSERLRGLGIRDLIAKPTTQLDLAIALHRAVQPTSLPTIQP